MKIEIWEIRVKDSDKFNNIISELVENGILTSAWKTKGYGSDSGNVMKCSNCGYSWVLRKPVHDRKSIIICGICGKKLK